MADNNQIKATQERVFRIAQRNGLTMKAIALDSEIPYNTLRSYAGSGCATAEMPVSALNKLCGVVPDELLSLLLPEGRQIIAVPDGIDHDEVERACRNYLDVKGCTHREDSPAQRDISDCEEVRLNTAAGTLRAVVG